MLPRLWGNTNVSNVKGGSLTQNGSGKFSDVDEVTLEYLKWLGCSHVWYTGVIRHSTAENPDNQGNMVKDSKAQLLKGKAGSPYAIKDYFDVNPYLADKPSRRMQEFSSLVARTHKAGLKVIIDFVPNHVARDYGKTVRKGMEPYVLGATDDCSVHWKAENDFYYYPGEKLQLPGNEAFGPEDRFEEDPAKATGNAFTSAPSINDWYETVKINYCDFHTQTWDKMAEVIKYWTSKGVDGFRCDMVELVPPEFFAWLIPFIKKEFPNLIFIAEVYDKSQYGKYIKQVGFDYLYDKSGLYDTVRGIVEGWGSATGITSNWQMLGDLQPNMLCFLENHDEQRFASEFFGKDARHSYAALYASLLLNTSPFMLYAGEELGERGMDAEGFSGRDGRTTIFDWWSVESLRHLHDMIHFSEFVDHKPVGLNDYESEVFARYSEVMRLARQSRAITEGQTYDLCWCNAKTEGFDANRHFIFLRHAASDGTVSNGTASNGTASNGSASNGSAAADASAAIAQYNETLLVACNFSSESAKFKAHIPSEALEFLQIKTSTPDGIDVDINLAPYDACAISL